MVGPSAREPGADEPLDGLLFCGNPHESVPRALFMDRRLTPLERNAWQVIRMQIAQVGMTAFPTYDALRPHLSSVPCSGRASDETIARALTLLRLTRWLSVVRHRRRSADGRIQGNVYVLHDEPLAPSEAIQLDPHYLSLVSDAITHASKAVQQVAFHTLKEVANDPLLSASALPSRLQILVQRMASHGWKLDDPREAIDAQDEEYFASADSNTMRAEHIPDSLGSRMPATPSSESEARHLSHLRNPKEDGTVRTVRPGSINKDSVRTVSRARATPSDAVAHWLERLAPEQRSAAFAALQQLSEVLRQAVLQEWAERCGKATVRHPARYLFGLIQRALRGEFNSRAPAEPHDGTPSEALPAATPPSRTDAQGQTAVRQHIETLRNLLHIR